MAATARAPKRRRPTGPRAAAAPGAAVELPGAHLLGYQRRWILDESPVKIWAKARRIGADYAEAAGVVLTRLSGRRPMDYWYSSADESAAEEFIRYVQHFAGAFKRLVEVVIDEEVCEGLALRKFVVEIPDPSGRMRRVTAMTSNPTRFRSKGGDVTLSELAFHQDPEGMLKAATPVTTRGGRLALISSHNGEGSLFNRLLRGAARRRDGQGRAGDLAMSVHETYLPEAIADGLVEQINRATGSAFTREGFVEHLRSMTLPADFAEEFLGVPSTAARSFFPFELLRACVHERDPRPTGDLHVFLADVRRACEREDRGGLGAEALYAGVDVGRTNHRFVIDACASLGGINRTAGILVLDRRDFAEMEFAIGSLLALRAGPDGRASVRRMAIDATGIGMQLGERMEQRWGRSRVEAVTFTASVKEDLATRTRAEVEERTTTLPDELSVLQDFHAIRQEVTAAGKPRYVGEEDERGHQDVFWARALTLYAAQSRSQVRAVRAERGAWL